MRQFQNYREMRNEMSRSDEENGLSCIIIQRNTFLKVNADISKRISMRVLKLALIIGISSISRPRFLHCVGGAAAMITQRLIS